MNSEAEQLSEQEDVSEELNQALEAQKTPGTILSEMVERKAAIAAEKQRKEAFVQARLEEAAKQAEEDWAAPDEDPEPSAES